MYTCICVYMCTCGRDGRFGDGKGEEAGLVSAPYLEGGESVLN